MTMTLRELKEVVDAHLAANPTAAELEVMIHLDGDQSITGRTYYSKVHQIDGQPCFLIVAMPKDWRFGRPDSPAALRSAAEKAEG